MAILKVARMGHPVLTEVAAPVDPAALGTPELQRLVDDMIETMRDERGVGLAGPQVHHPLRLFVMELPEDVPGPSGPVVIVNPSLTFPGRRTWQLWEGCLSMPGIRGLTQRWRRVRLEGLDRHGESLQLDLEGYAAAVVQHETDHLDGILFLHRMPDLSRIAFEDELARHPEIEAGGEREEGESDRSGSERESRGEEGSERYCR